MAFAFAAAAQGQPQPTLEIPSFDPSGGLRFAVHGQTGTNYAVEASSDLGLWWRVSSGKATNGQVPVMFHPSGARGTRYFRALVDAPLPPANVKVQAEGTPRALALATPESGGTLSITDQRGVKYLLTVPAKVVREPEVF